MNKLIVHHSYSNGLAFDLSDNRNHGIPEAVVRGVGAFDPSFAFNNPDSKVTVPANPTLENLYTMSVSVLAYITAVPLSRRYNLVEGHLCFALFVNADSSITGGILDASGNWTGATSLPGLVRPGEWFSAELRHDGISRCDILLNGSIVTTNYNMRGPVRSVGPNGLVVGHWPEPPGVYTLEGYVRELKLYKYDPALDIRGLLDWKCLDREATDRLVHELRAKGVTGNELQKMFEELMQIGNEAMADVRGGDAATTQATERLVNQAMGALVRGDATAYMRAFARLGVLGKSRLSAARAADLEKALNGFIDRLPEPLRDYEKLARMLCLDKATMDPDKLLELLQKYSRNQQPGGKVKS